MSLGPPRGAGGSVTPLAKASLVTCLVKSCLVSSSHVLSKRVNLAALALETCTSCKNYLTRQQGARQQQDRQTAPRYASWYMTTAKQTSRQQQETLETLGTYTKHQLS